jgi:hypothetical protein
MKYGKLIKIPAYVGCHSLVDVGKERPTSWGNYFWFASKKEDLISDSAIRCLNFWAENLDSAREQFLTDNEVEVILYEEGWDKKKQWAIIVDERIPKDWFYNKLCFTGGWNPPIYALKEMYDILSDEEYEFEQFIDPISYWEKRDSEWRNGIVRTQVKATTRKLDVKWTCKTEMNSGVFYCPDIAPIKIDDSTLRIFGQKKVKND